MKLKMKALSMMFFASFFAHAGEGENIAGVEWKGSSFAMFNLGASMGGFDGMKAAKQISSWMVNSNKYCKTVVPVGNEYYVDNGFLCVRFECDTIVNRTKFVVINPGNGDITYNAESCHG